MESVILLLFFIYGLIFGSFFNVVGLRVPKQQSIAKGRSFCPHCQHQLSWYELIPLFSYIWQRGKCRHCQGKIAPIYPIIELLTGILFTYNYYLFGFHLELLTSLLLISMLMIIFVADLTYMIIPNKVLIFFLPLFIIVRILHPLDPWWSSLLGAGVIFLLLVIIILISKGGMGGGDLKLFALLGFVLGIKQVLFAFLMSCLLGAIIGVFLMALGKTKRKQPMAFGPYIVIATLFTYYFGDGVIDWYLSIF